MAELASLERALARVNVSNGSEDAADVLLLLRAISDDYRRRTGRPYEGTPTIYEERVDTGYERDFYLPHVPVTDVLSIANVDWDGTIDAIWTPEPAVKSDGSASWTTLLAASAAIGATNLKVDSVTGITVGDHVALRDVEVARITTVGTAGAGGTGLDIEPALTLAHASGSRAHHVDSASFWNLIDADRGHIELRGRRRFVRARWRTSGLVPTHVADDVIEWLASRWEERKRQPGLTAYSTGDDSETFDPSQAGDPPRSVGRGLMRNWHPTRNGVV